MPRTAKRGSRHVSPFMDMDMNYDFAVRPPGARVMIRVDGGDSAGPLIGATFAARRRPLTDGQLLRAFVTVPLVTLKTVAGIHWEALMLWLKGLAVRRVPPPPTTRVTIGR